MSKDTQQADGIVRVTGAAAMAWAWEQDLPMGEKLLLLAIADQASSSGVWMWGAQVEMAAMTGMGVRTIGRHLASLEERGLIGRAAQYELGNRVADHITLAIHALPANLAGSAKTAGNGRSISANLTTGQIGRAHPSSSSGSTSPKRSSRSKNARPGQIGVQDNLDIPDEMRADAAELLRRKQAVDRRVVTEQEMTIAAAALAEFNRQLDSDYGLGANLKSIVMRIRERPSWDAAKHVRLVQSAFRIKWWERNGRAGRRASPQVIYGERAFEKVVQDARNEAEACRRLDSDHDLRGKVWPDGTRFEDLTPGAQTQARRAVEMGLKPWLPQEEQQRPVVNGTVQPGALI